MSIRENSIRENVIKSLEVLIKIEGSKSAFANKVGVSRAAVTNWTSGYNAPDIETVAKIANAYSVPLSDILDDKLTESSTSYAYVNLDSDTRWVNVPLCGSIAAGKPIEMESVQDTFTIPYSLHKKYPDAFLLQVDGESMNRKLPNGSYALINPTEEVINGRAYAICVNGYDATIKRVKQLENGFELSPDSTDPTIKSRIYDYNEEGTETITVIGEVVWCVFPFDYAF